MTALGIIPARGGSKGVPRKNQRQLGDKPLIAHTIEAGLAAMNLSRLIVSTDSEEIAEISRAYGAEVPFMRPDELVSDTSLQIDVALHALEEAERTAGTHYDCTVLLQPTSPLRIASDIDSCLEQMENGGTDSVVSFCRVEQGHPYYMYTIRGGHPAPLMDKSLPARRQEFPEVYLRNGAVYVTRRSVLQQRTFYGLRVSPYIMPSDRSVNIDTELDFAMAELLLTKMQSYDDTNS